MGRLGPRLTGAPRDMGTERWDRFDASCGTDPTSVQAGGEGGGGPGRSAARRWSLGAAVASSKSACVAGGTGAGPPGCAAPQRVRPPAHPPPARHLQFVNPIRFVLRRKAANEAGEVVGMEDVPSREPTGAPQEGGQGGH